MKSESAGTLGGGVATGALYRFKDIPSVPDAKSLIDIVLSKTQRKTPTQVHKAFKISRIRSFYMRKVKFCQQTIHDKLTEVLSHFPRLDDIHPFYGDLCNVLYDRDHYKLALGQCNTVRGVVDTLAKDYVRLMKYADSLYKCKMLKRAALGRMCTAVKKLQASFVYLEEVRQHLARLPSINPHTRTLILAGYPNVGKSSFMNKVSNANVEVEPYAFTTKSLFLGHFDFAYSRWQIIDTPGVLDRPLEDRNTIEMTAITALAHIQCAVLYLIDVSEECGFTLTKQLKLFVSLQPLFRNKPIVIVLNKTDRVKFTEVDPELQKQIRDLGLFLGGEHDEVITADETAASNLIKIVETSTLSGEGVDKAKDTACEMLLEQRVQAKYEAKRIDSIANRLQIATPRNSTSERSIHIPDSVIRRRERRQQRKLMGLDEDDREMMDNEDLSDMEQSERRLEEKEGGPGVYSADTRRKYIMANPDWKYDIVPEFFGDKNISDFVDPDIMKKLEELENEEAKFSKNEVMANPDNGVKWVETQKKLAELHSAIELRRFENKLRKKRGGINVLRKATGTVSDLEKHLSHLGIDPNSAVERTRQSRAYIRRGNSRKRADSEGSMAMDEDGRDDNESGSAPRRGRAALRPRIDKKQSVDPSSRVQSDKGVDAISTSTTRSELSTRLRSRSLSRTQSTNPRDRSRSLAPSRIELSIPDVEKQKKVEKIKRRAERQRNMFGKAGEADRFIGTKMPKHLFSGKRGIGKTQRR